MSDDNDDLLDPAEIEALLNEAGAGQPPPSAPKDAAEEVGDPSATAPSATDAQAAGDTMSQDELDRLMAEATTGTASLNAPPQESQPPTTPTEDDGDGDLLDPSEIEQLLSGHNPAAKADRPATPTKTAPASQSSAGTEELLRQAEAGLAAAISSDGGGFTKTGPFGNPQPYTFEEFAKPSASAAHVALNTLHDVELDIRIELGRTELLIEEVLQLRDGSVVPLDKLAGDPVDVIVNERLIARGEVLVLNDNFCVRITEILPPHL